METQKLVKNNGDIVVVDCGEINYRNGELKTISQALISRKKSLARSEKVLAIIEKSAVDFDFKTIGQIEKFYCV